MSAQARDRLADALELVAGNPDAIINPSEAIAKAAAVEDVPANHLELLVHAYNNSRAAVVRDEGATTADRAAGYKLASLADVMASAYPEPAIAASPSKTAEVAVEEAANLDPRRWYVSRQEKAAREARRRAVLESGERITAKWAADAAAEAAAKAADPVVVARKAVLAARAAADVSREMADATAAEVKAAAAIDALTDELSLPGAAALVDVKTAALSLYGDVGGDVVDTIAARRPRLTEAVGGWFPAASEHPRMYDLLKTAAESLASLAEVNAALREARDSIGEKIAAALAPAIDPPATPPGDFADDLLLATPVVVKDAALGVPSYGSIFKAYGDYQGKLRADANSTSAGDSRADKLMRKIDDSVQDVRLADLDSRFAVSDMLLHDPVISSHSPNDVAQMYNEISRAAPELARQPLLMRPLLRRSLELGNIDTFDAGEALSGEKALRQLKNIDSPRSKERE